MVEVRNLNNAERVVVEINDRGPFVKGRIIDLSYEAARKLGIVEDGTAPVDLRLLLLGDVDKKRLKYRVQVGSFADWTNARELQNRLRRQYPDVVIQPWVGPQGRFYRVRVGPYATLRDAEIAAGQLEDQGLTTFLVQD
jgi:rare lipoprotein A